MKTYIHTSKVCSATIHLLSLFIIAGLLVGCGSSHEEHEEACCNAIYERALGVLLTDAYDGGPIVGAPILVSDANGYFDDYVVETDGSGYASIVFDTDGVHNPGWVVYVEIPGYYPYHSGVMQSSASNPSIVIDLALQRY